MTPEQRYFFDVTGYLHLPGVLAGDDLASAQEAADRYISLSPDDWPPGFGADLERQDHTGYEHGFAFDKALEDLTRHPATWPILMELTDHRPRFGSGTLMRNRHGHLFHPLHAGWNYNHRPDTRRLWVEDGKIRCTAFIFFFYLTDVFPGDGGFMVLPGSHKSNFPKPKDMFYTDTYYLPDVVADEVHPGVASLTARAGDVLIASERLIHGALTWQPRDRERRFLTLRYSVQHTVTSSLRPFPDPIRERLSPETLELIELAPYNHVKDIVRERCGDSFEGHAFEN